MRKLVPGTLIVALQGANVPTKLFKDTKTVRQFTVYAGPSEAGVANATALYLGGADTRSGEGNRLEPGDFAVFEAFGEGEVFDLSTFYVIGATAADVLRVTYLTAD